MRPVAKIYAVLATVGTIVEFKYFLLPPLSLALSMGLNYTYYSERGTLAGNGIAFMLLYFLSVALWKQSLQDLGRRPSRLASTSDCDKLHTPVDCGLVARLVPWFLWAAPIIIAVLVIARIDTVTAERRIHDRAVAEMDTLLVMLMRYRDDNSAYPATTDGLAALLSRPTNAPCWRGPYLSNGIPADPWGRQYVYHSLDAARRRCSIVSLGPPGKVDHPIEFTSDELCAAIHRAAP